MNTETELYTEDMSWVPNLDALVTAARKEAHTERFEADPINIFCAFIVQEYERFISRSQTAEVSNA